MHASLRSTPIQLATGKGWAYPAAVGTTTTAGVQGSGNWNCTKLEGQCGPHTAPEATRVVVGERGAQPTAREV